MRITRYVLIAGVAALGPLGLVHEVAAQQRRGPVEFTIRRPPDNNLPGVRRFGDGAPPQAVPSPGHYYRVDLEPFWYRPGPPRSADPRGFMDGWHGNISPGFPFP